MLANAGELVYGGVIGISNLIIGLVYGCRNGQNQGLASQRPDLPPRFSSRPMDSMRMPRSTALHMS
jgi:hypothetical protein